MGRGGGSLFTEGMIPVEWTPCRRPEDAELVGYLTPAGDRVVPVTLFGYPLAGPSDVDTAVAVLRARGLACLADRWLLSLDSSEVEVRILSASADRLRVVQTEYGYFGPDSPQFTVQVPAADRLRPPAA